MGSNSRPKALRLPPTGITYMFFLHGQNYLEEFMAWAFGRFATSSHGSSRAASQASFYWVT